MEISKYTAPIQCLSMFPDIYLPYNVAEYLFELDPASKECITTIPKYAK